jgi:hypothetical protein
VRKEEGAKDELRGAPNSDSELKREISSRNKDSSATGRTLHTLHWFARLVLIILFCISAVMY